MIRRWPLWALSTVLLGTLLHGCTRPSRNAQAPNQQGGYAQPYPGQYPNQPTQQYPQPPGNYQQPQGYPQQTQQPVPQVGVPSGATLPIPNINTANDPINNVDLAFLQQRSGSVYSELVGSLQSTYKSRVSSIPLVFDNDAASVNAFAACTGSGKALIALTDGILDIQAHLAQARATDEIFGTRKVDEYIQFIAQNQVPDQPVVRPPASFFTPQQKYDARKVQRQHEVYEEEVGFVLSHELAHHYLGHLPCTAGGGPLNTAEIGWALSSAIPFFNQPNEVAADVNGTQNVLNSGRARNGYHWTEAGGLLTMQFFGGMDQLSPQDILFGFESSHPAPQIRIPIIQTAANNWRGTGGIQLPFPLPF